MIDVAVEGKVAALQQATQRKASANQSAKRKKKHTARGKRAVSHEMPACASASLTLMSVSVWFASVSSI